MPGFPEKITVDCRGCDSHKHQIRRKGQIGIYGQYAPGTGCKHHCCVDQCVQGIHSQKAGRHDSVIDNGLKHDGRASNGNCGDQHGGSLWDADLHGISEKFRIVKLHAYSQIGGGYQQSQKEQHKKLFLVFLISGRLHRAPPFNKGHWIFGAFRPWRSRWKSSRINRRLPRIPTISSIGSS